MGSTESGGVIVLTLLQSWMPDLGLENLDSDQILIEVLSRYSCSTSPPLYPSTLL
jgi:hypothetical protein